MPFRRYARSVVAAANQRSDAGVLAALTLGLRAAALRDLRDRGGARPRKRIGADRWQSRRPRRPDRANKDCGKNITHFVTPYGPTGLCLEPRQTLITVRRKLGGKDFGSGAKREKSLTRFHLGRGGRNDERSAAKSASPDRAENERAPSCRMPAPRSGWRAEKRGYENVCDHDKGTD